MGLFFYAIIITMIRHSTYYSDNDRRSALVVEEDDGRFCAICVEYDRRCIRATDFIKGATSSYHRYYDNLIYCEDFAENWVQYKD